MDKDNIKQLQFVQSYSKQQQLVDDITQVILDADTISNAELLGILEIIKYNFLVADD